MADAAPWLEDELGISPVQQGAVPLAVNLRASGRDTVPGVGLTGRSGVL